MYPANLVTKVCSYLSLYTFKTTYKVLSLHPFLSYPTISNLLSAETIPVRSAPDASILPVSSTHAFPLLACLLRLCPRPISNSQLHALLHFHLCPIYLVVFKGSYSCDGISHLEGGFTLRCLQRLSLPDLATLPCLWQDNRYTSGRSSPVLSY